MRSERKQRILDGREAEVYGLLKQGHSMAKAARVLEVHRSTLKSFLRSHGVISIPKVTGGWGLWGLGNLRKFMEDAG